MGEISPIGDRSNSSRVQPINWTERADLNQRRTANPHFNQRPEGGVPIEEVPQLDIYDGETPLSRAGSFGKEARYSSESGAKAKAESMTERIPERKPEPRAEPKTKSNPEPNPKPNPEPNPEPLAEVKPAPKAPITVEPQAVAQISPKTVAQTMQEMPLADLQAKRAALIKAGTADSISELVFVNEELAARGQFRSVLGSGARQGNPAALSAPEPTAVAPECPMSPTVKLSPDQLPPAVRSMNLHPEEVNSSFLKSFAGPLARVTTYGFGALGVVGGLFQMRNGVDEMLAGNYGEGSVTSLSGLCNTTAGGAAFFSSMPLANSLATRAGGLGALLDGGLQLYKGYTTGNEVQLVDGGVKTTLGGTMMTGGPVGWCAGAAYAGWSAGRFLGGVKVSGESTLDDVVTQGIYNMFYA